MGPTKYHEMAVETVETIVGKTGTCESAVLGEPNVERLSRPERARPMARHSPKKRQFKVQDIQKGVGYSRDFTSASTC